LCEHKHFGKGFCMAILGWMIMEANHKQNKDTP
jgi:hypothetical protein